jgi:hypothetical protein
MSLIFSHVIVPIDYIPDRSQSAMQKAKAVPEAHFITNHTGFQARGF